MSKRITQPKPEAKAEVDENQNPMPDIETTQNGDTSGDEPTVGAQASPEPPKVSTQNSDPKPQSLSKDPYAEIVKRYSKLYPNNRIFHITSDMQVFLAADKSLAVMHQNSLGVEAKVQSITI